jgi:hypothetical protein
MSERILNVDHNEAIEYNGRKFRSKLELQTAKTLDALGIPYDYETRKIVLQDSFRCPFQKDKVRQLTYTADFIIGPLMIECKGFETPEWKIKKKLIFKWLMDNEPETIFYQIHDARKELLQVINKHLPYLGLAIRVTSKATRKKPSESKLYSSIDEALDDIHLNGMPWGSIMSVLLGKREYSMGYNFKFEKITL